MTQARFDTWGHIWREKTLKDYTMAPSNPYSGCRVEQGSHIGRGEGWRKARKSRHLGFIKLRFTIYLIRWLDPRWWQENEGDIHIGLELGLRD